MSSDRAAVIDILTDTPEFAPVDSKVACELLDAYYEEPKGSSYLTFVAEHDGSIAGYVCFGPTPLTEGVWDVYWIAVSRKVRGTGIGRALMEVTEIEVRKSGGRMILIETSSTEPYQSARQLYLKMGYRIEAMVSDFYKEGDAKVIFQKKLR
ncbi:MAG: GNAT family N-acetyltransferase [Chloroflexota bacterium]